VEAEPYDVDGEAEFLLGFDLMGSKQLAGGVACRRQVAACGEEEQHTKLVENLVQRGGRDDGREGHGQGLARSGWTFCLPIA
jgi:hypothetical protein